MRTFLIIIVLFFAFASYARAQEANDVFIERTTAFTIGKTQRLDTYLSQEEYSGTDYRFISNVLRIRPNKWDFQFTHEGALDYTHNRVENANTLAGHYDFAFAMMKRLDKFENSPFTLRYEVRVPMIGIMFSPAYGQSYYELFNNGNYDNNIVFTSVAIPQLRHQLSAEYPISKNTNIRIGYFGDYRQSKPNNLKQHTYTNSFLIGFTLRK